MYTRKKIVNIEKKDNSCYNQQEKKKQPASLIKKFKL